MSRVPVESLAGQGLMAHRAPLVLMVTLELRERMAEMELGVHKEDLERLAPLGHQEKQEREVLRGLLASTDCLEMQGSREV